MDNPTCQIGISQIAWLNDDFPELNISTLDEALSDMVEIGYSGCEYGNSFPTTKEELQPILDKYNLDLVSGWYSGLLGERSFKQEKQAMAWQINLFKEMKCPVIVYGECSNTLQASPKIPLINKPKLPFEQFKLYANRLDDLAKYCNDCDLPLSLHQHMGTLVQTEEETLYVLENTDEVNLAFDTGHYLMATMDEYKILEVVQKYGSRINHVHFKDIRKEKLNSYDERNDSFVDSFLNGIFTVPGDGMINYAPIIQALKEHRYQGWYIIEAEQNPKTYNPYTYSLKGFKYLKKQLVDSGYQIKNKI